MFDTTHHPQAGLGGQEIQQFNSPQHVPQSPHLPMSPPYTNPHAVPHSPQVPQSPLLQRQSSVEPLQSPGPDYSNQGMPVQDMGMGSRFGGHGVHDYSAVQGSADNNALLHNLHQQLQLQNQTIHMNSLQTNDNISLQNAQIASLHNPSIPNSASMDLNSQLQQQMAYNNQTVNLQHGAPYHSQVSGQFHVGAVVPSEGQVVLGDNNASELMSQLITSLENLGEVPPGAMHEISKPETELQQLTNRVFPADNTRQFPQQTMAHENGMNNSLNEFAHNSVLHNQGVSSSFNTSQFVSQPQLTESRGSVKQELLKHLASKPLSPRATQGVQFPFQNSVNANTQNTSNPGGTLSQRQRHHSAKAELNPHSGVSKVSEPNSELKRRLSAGPEDVRLQSFASAPDIGSRTYIRSGPTPDDLTRPRMRSKSGDDHRLHKWRTEDLFTKPKVKVEDFAHRPRSKTDEHLPKWKRGDALSKSDGAGVFRNPSSMAPGSLKMRRKHRPAPLIIPSHANMCGFQSRLRSPRIFLEGENGSKTAPVPYTPPPMLSPLRRGSGLFSSLNSASTIAAGTPQPGTSAGSVSTPRPSLLRSGE